MNARTAITTALLETRVMAILRGPEPTHIETVAAGLAKGGIRCIEVSLTTPGALDLIGRLRAALPVSVSIGAGTVIACSQAGDALAAGAEFLVAPLTNPDVIDMCVAASVAIYPGAFTPTEIVQAWERGATAVKVFPAMLGGPAYFSQLRQPLPAIPLMAVGGVSTNDAASYLAAGATAIGIGSSVAYVRDDDTDLNEVAARARHLLANCAPATATNSEVERTA